LLLIIINNIIYILIICYIVYIIYIIYITYIYYNHRIYLLSNYVTIILQTKENKLQVSFTGAPEFMSVGLGFGNASWWIFEAFKQHKLNPIANLSTAQIGVSFCPPNEYRFGGEHQYKIGYTPWESSDFHADWYPRLAECDEVWTTSTWNKGIFENNLQREVFVFPHGIDHNFSPMRRKYFPNQPFTFLYIGEPFNRKDGQLVYDTFTRLYGNDDRYQLIVKCTPMDPKNISTINEVTTGEFGDPYYRNVIFIKTMLSVEDLIKLYSYAHCFVYPSWGEGFGFNPFQALAMGIPTICTSEWAEYKKYITLPLDSVWARSPWQDAHPGYMLKPSGEQLEQHMLDVVKNYDKYASIAFKNSFKIHEEYDWLEISKPAVEKIKNIVKSRI